MLAFIAAYFQETKHVWWFFWCAKCLVSQHPNTQSHRPLGRQTRQGMIFRPWHFTHLLLVDEHDHALSKGKMMYLYHWYGCPWFGWNVQDLCSLGRSISPYLIHLCLCRVASKMKLLFLLQVSWYPVISYIHYHASYALWQSNTRFGACLKSYPPSTLQLRFPCSIRVLDLSFGVFNSTGLESRGFVSPKGKLKSWTSQQVRKS